MTSYAFQPTVLAAMPENQFSTLPKVRAPWAEFGFGIAAQTLLVGSIVWARLLYPSVVVAPEHNFRSVLLVSTPQPLNLQPQPPLILQQPAEIAHLDPSDIALPLPERQPKIVTKLRIKEDETAPAVSLTPKKLEPMVSDVAPILPQEAVKTNVFSTGSSAQPTMARRTAEVQTGGFGDPNGLPAKPDQKKGVTIAALGSFDLPRSSEAGYGNGTGRTKGVAGVVTSAGFGNGTAIETQSHASLGKVQPSGFGDADVPAAPTVHSQPAEAALKVVPAEIISKPTPAYTQEARNLRIEGEVLVEAVLQASGSLRVVRVVRGLGHGLDDNAVRAAEKIHFRPALKNGEPADSTVVLHIIFQLA